MYDSTIHRDYVKTETEYRLGRVRSDLAGRRQRRALSRRNGGIGDAGDITFTTAR